MRTNERGITLIILMVTIFIILILVGVMITGSHIFERASMQALASDMLLIQTKVKIINEKVAYNGDTSIYVGQKLKDNPNKAKIAKDSLTAQELEMDSYYIYDRATLDRLGLEGIKLKQNEVYIVNYENGEVIWPQGVKTETGERVYRLSQMVNNSLIKREYSNDKVPPILKEPNWKILVNSITLTVNAVDGYSGVAGYQFYIDGVKQLGASGDEWEKSNVHTFSDLAANTIYKIQFKVIDHAGNVATSQEYKITTSLLGEAALTMKLGARSGEDYVPGTWTNQNVYLYFSGDTNNVTYLVQGAVNIPETKEPILLTKDGVYQVYQKVKNGEDTTTLNPVEVKIDKTAPIIVSMEKVQEGKNITINYSIVTDEKSGISSAKWYASKVGETYTEVANVTTEVQSSKTATLHYTANELATFQFKLIVTDNVGNEVYQEVKATMGWDFTKIASTVKETSEVTGTTKEREVPIPKGFTPSQVPGENTIAGGLVIYQTETQVNSSNHATALTAYNQYVWIPVDDINQMVMCKSNTGSSICNLALQADGTLQCTNSAHEANKTNLCGRLYGVSATTTDTATPKAYTTAMNFGDRSQTWTNSSWREPGIVSNCDKDDSTSGNNYMELAGIGDKTVASFSAQLTDDFKNMAVSVAKYGGFYVSRYEAGENGASKKNQKVLTAAGDTSDVYIGANTWYGLYGTLRKKIKQGEISILQSHMIYGSQYDQIIKFIGEEAQKGHPEKQTTTQKTTGYEGDNDILKNIYDLEGNNYEWTAQASLMNLRVSRGGGYTLANIGYFYPASDRTSDEPPSTLSYNASRVTLYL